MDWRVIEKMDKKIDQLLELTHKNISKNLEQDVEIREVKQDIKELKPLKEKAAQLTGAIRLLVLLGIGSVSGILIKFFL